MKVAMFALSSLVLFACNDKEPGAVATLEFHKLGDLDLEAEIPAGSLNSRRKNAFGSITVETDPKVEVRNELSLDWAKDLAAAKQALAAVEGFDGFAREEAGVDGTFRLEYKKKLGDGVGYGFQIRRKIADKYFDCGTKAWDESLVDLKDLLGVIKICESLRAPL